MRRDALYDRVGALGATEVIRFLGWRDQGEVFGLLNETDVLIAPSGTAADGDREGIPNVTKEAMAAGIPILGTKHAGILELVDDGVSGFLVDERDVDALSERLLYLCAHPEVWPVMGRRGRDKVLSCFEADGVNRRQESLYGSIISQDGKVDHPREPYPRPA